MKGIVFKVLEDIVLNAYGVAVWDDLLEKSGASGVYTSLGSYPDEEMARLVSAVGERFGMTEADVLRWYGQHFIPYMAGRYPEFFTPHTDTASFVLTLNRIIHPEVRKLYPGADVPVFAYETLPDGALGIGYHSPRKMCAFAEGLIQGAAAHYGESVTLTQPECMWRGDDRCLIECRFQPLAAHA